MKRKYLALAACLTWVFCIPSESAFAGRLSALLGPPSLGQGGSNPISVPPANPLDWQLSWLTDKDQEFMLSVIPGFFYSQRWRKDQFAIGFGGGLLISANGPGVGLSQSLHWESTPFWTNWRLEAEYRQVIGVTEIGAEFPYAIRFGTGYQF